MDYKIYNLPPCRDLRGSKCFASEKVKADQNYRIFCTCLSDTRKSPCPFFKTKEDARKENMSE